MCRSTSVLSCWTNARSRLLSRFVVSLVSYHSDAHMAVYAGPVFIETPKCLRTHPNAGARNPGQHPEERRTLCQGLAYIVHGVTQRVTE